MAETYRQEVTAASVREDLKRGFLDILPVLVAAFPIALLWGTLAVKKGLSPLEAVITSAAMFGGAAQFVALDLWREPAPWLLLSFSVLVVNIRHVLMGLSLSRHFGGMPKALRAMAMFLMVDEVWAFAERRALSAPLSAAYYFGLGVPLWINWVAATVAGAALGRGLGDPAAYGFDFAFSAMFIAILAGFWKGPRTGAVLAASCLVAAVTKLAVPGAWYIALGGLAGVTTAALLASPEDLADGD